MSETNPSIKAMVKAVKRLPKEGLPEVLSAVIKECIDKKVFGEKDIPKVVETIARTSVGKTSQDV